MALHAQGWNVIPVDHGTKFPSYPWKHFQEQRVTQEDLDRWWPEGGGSPSPGSLRSPTSPSWGEVIPTPLPGIAVVCGSISKNLVCLDFDDAEAYFKWCEVQPDARSHPTAKSSRGYHVFFQTPEPIPSGTFFVPSYSEERHAGDLISEGKLVVLPPTRHPTGPFREWIVTPTQAGGTRTAEVWAMGVRSASPLSRFAERAQRYAEPPKRVGKGGRHTALIKAAANLKLSFLPDAARLAALEAYNDAQLDPPLPRSEVLKAHDWASKAATAREDQIQELSELMPISYHPSNNGYNVRLVTLEAKEEIDQLETAFQPAPEYVAEQDSLELRWLVQDFLPQGYLTVLGGTSKAGKSCFVTALAMAVARGEPFLGKEVSQAAVLWCPYEESRTERSYILNMFGELPDNLFLTDQNPLIDDDKGLQTLDHWVRKTGAKLLVIDPLYAASAASSLSEGKSARNALQGLKQLCNEHECTAIVIHHFTKQVGAGLVRERLADSNQIAAAASMDILMDATDEPGGTRLIRLACKGRGLFANQTWIVRSEGPTHFELVTHGQGVSTEAITRERSIVKYLDEVHAQAMVEGGAVEGEASSEPLRAARTSDQIAEALGLHPRTVKNTMTGLAKSGAVALVRRGKGHAKALYASVSVSSPTQEVSDDESA